ncbi:DNA polymerase III subunit delta' [Anaerobacillus alkalilacustris]|uniref:DNA polymerase III subunit delta' n=1 Tax=Anaerobacillus alkalilacustris TaxID=393763 RepID=A0A1S2LYJ9_9BACI|nr:DNA polymerase III subunit delta' [Anaerobacillus alkalilacustris]OIJ17568.1 DNA polymerase III subunit delta' [Anaerobacillus alkalilacustris]
MTWNEIKETQEKVVKIITNSIRKQRLAHAYLFEGAKGTGKRKVALQLAKTFFCDEKEGVEACGTCSDCKRIESGNHPDVHIIQPDGQTIKIDQIRNLKKEFSYRGMESIRKFYIIEDAEKMTISAANGLLKFLEEPDGQSIAVLTTTEVHRILSTILSRTQILSFVPLTPLKLMETLEKNGVIKPITRLLGQLTNDIEEAYQLYHDDWIVQARAIMIQLVEEVSTRPHQVFLTLQENWFPHFKEKNQLNLGLDLLLLWYRDVLRTLIATEDQLIFVDHTDKLERQALNSSQRKVGQQMAAILEAKRRLSANVNPQLLMEQLMMRLQEG